MSEALLIVPCFNEASRLDHAELLRLAARPEVALCFVDDGSTDDTLAELQSLANQRPEKIQVQSLPQNVGKAEAVRQGLLGAVAAGRDIIGFVDADLATPVDEIVRLLGELVRRPEAEIVIGARVAMAGAVIDRHASRHLTGRIFATAASLVLGEPFYDTQCGAKVFRNTPALRSAIEERFLSRWAFDVELLGRLQQASKLTAGGRTIEVPLSRWTDVAGSKLRLRDMVRSGTDLLRIHRELSRRRRKAP
ncbi:MAG: glycosyltransferase [Deltaproteobacteria bacterium]|nr:glycosyltransferase [Deltaproteobacteria bacterium]